MKILWLVNITLPDACEALGRPTPVLGGWLTGYRDALLANHPDVELHIVEPYWGQKATETTTTQLDCAVKHHLFPESWIEEGRDVVAQRKSQLTARSNRLAAWFAEIHDEIRPDAVHLHGTEKIHTSVWAQTCGMEHTVVSIQGLASVYAQYYMGGLTQEELQGCWSFNDWRFGRTLAKGQRQLAEHGYWEKRLLCQTSHVAGRTTWDKSHAWAMNPKAQYHLLQEVLRTQFYEAAGSWNLEGCQRHTIFVSQSHYPIKGLHRLLDALPLILRHYPDTQLYIVGEDRLDQHWRHRSQYVNVLRRKATGLRDHIHYLDTLSAEQMVEHYQKANVFCCPSAIENSCNSVCEAQMIGTPVVASYVGGMMDLIRDGENGLLYRYEEVAMLADKICQVFADDALAQRMSQQAAATATQRHDRRAVADTLYNIYKEL